MHYLLFYEVGEDYVSKRAQFRGLHLKKAWEASERCELVLAGALAKPVDGPSSTMRHRSHIFALRPRPIAVDAVELPRISFC